MWDTTIQSRSWNEYGDGMNRGQNQTIAILNKLIDTCRDGQEGFLAAADRIPDGDLKALFNSYSRQRAQFLRELQEEVRRRGGELETTGSHIGALRRGWIDMKAPAVGVGEEAIITECERGENAAVKSYQEAIAAQLSGDLLARVQQHYTQIRESYDLIRALEQART
jgi:uncharacterized protein (TIGR02284 family)